MASKKSTVQPKVALKKATNAKVVKPEPTKKASPIPAAPQAEAVKGKIVALAGVFSSMRRSEVIKELAALGAVFSNTISSETQLLFAGECSVDNTKPEQAHRLKIRVLGEHDLLVILGKADPKDKG